MTSTAARGMRAIWLTLLFLIALAADVRGGQDWRARALASFDEVWQTINDRHYDPSFGGVDWAAVRSELRARAERAESADGVRDVIREMLARLGQSHFVLMTASAGGHPIVGDAVVPIAIRVLPDGVVVTRVEQGSPAETVLPIPGDVLASIDGQDLRVWIAEAEGRDERVRRLVVWQRVFSALHGAPGTIARLGLRRPDGSERTIDAVRARKPGAAVTLGNLPPFHVRTDAFERRTPRGRRVGVIGFNLWMTAVADPFAQAIDRFRDADGVIIDLRGNPGGLAEMLRGIAGHFLPTPELLGRMQMRGVSLEFRANPRRSTSDGRQVEPYAGPLAILVDELSGSASECFAGAMQSLGRARIFGSGTMGQALPASTRDLSNGDVLMYAVGDFVTATGQRLEGSGVRPDEPVVLSTRALASGQDLALDAALTWIDGVPRGFTPSPPTAPAR